MLQKRVNLFGLMIDDIPMSRAIELAKVSILGGEKRVFFTPNLQMLESARKLEETKKILNSASVLIPDGAGLLLASHFMRKPIKNKVAGIDFGEEIISLSEKEGKTIFLLGGAKGVAKRAAKKLLIKYPSLKICGIHNGYFDTEDEGALIKKIKNANPDILIVCMGFPKQERFVYEHRNDFTDIKVITCLGGALDVWAGKKMRAPILLQRAHLEWLWRILAEPKRAKRFLSSLPVLFYAAWNENEK